MTDRSNQVQLVTFCHKPGHIAGSGIKMEREKKKFLKSMRLVAFSPIDTNCIMQLSIDAQNGEKLLDRGEFWYYDTS